MVIKYTGIYLALPCRSLCRSLPCASIARWVPFGLLAPCWPLLFCHALLFVRLLLQDACG